MAALLIGYARCSTDQQDLTAQRDGPSGLGVAVNRVYVDHDLLMMLRVGSGSLEAAKEIRRDVSAAVAGPWLAAVDLDMRRLPGGRFDVETMTQTQRLVFRLLRVPCDCSQRGSDVLENDAAWDSAGGCA